MITKNAAETLEKSLTSIKKIASEIIIVDGGSTDNTINIAKKYQAKIFSYLGKNWGRQCQVGLEKATGDWVLVLDSDEVVPAKLTEEILSVIRNSQLNNSGYYIGFQNHYFGHPLKYGGENYKKMILFKKKSGFVRRTLVHYYYEIKNGRIGYLKNKIFHYSYLSIPQVYKKFTDYGIRMAKEKHLAGEKSSLKKVFLYSAHLFWARFIKDKGYKDGLFRIPLDLGFAYMEFITYIFLLYYNVVNSKVKSQNEKSKV